MVVWLKRRNSEGAKLAMEIKKIGVLGCGLMGSGIAQVAASAGFETVVREVSEDLIKKGFGGIEKSLAKFAEKGTITAEQQKEIRGRLSGTTSFADLADCDIIIEAIIETSKRSETLTSSSIRFVSPRRFSPRTPHRFRSLK
jgi:3-hydroxybutyryl-CoA dehydrogenase